MPKKVVVALDEAREIKFSINAMVELENRFDKSIPELFSQGVPGIKHMVAMLRIGLKHGGMKFPKGVTSVEDQELLIGDLVQQHWIDQGRTMTELMESVTDALEHAGLFKRPSEEEEDDKNPPASGVGA